MKDLLKATSVLRYMDHRRQLAERKEADVKERLKKGLSDLSQLCLVAVDARKASVEGETQRLVATKETKETKELLIKRTTEAEKVKEDLRGWKEKAEGWERRVKDAENKLAWCKQSWINSRRTSRQTPRGLLTMQLCRCAFLNPSANVPRADAELFVLNRKLYRFVGIEGMEEVPL